MLSLQNSAFSLICFAILSGVSCDDLTPVKTEEFSPEGSSVTLSYRYSKVAASNDYFFWYRQYPGEPPEFLLSISGLNLTNKAESLGSDTRFFTDLSEGKQRVDLQISSAAVTDSAVYYCAVGNAFSSQKIIFGGGTRVTVETKELYKPSYYKFKDETTPLCLATGFSRIRGADEDKKDIFNNRTGAVRIEGDSLFNQVGYLPYDGSGDQKCGTEGGPVDCDDSLQPDPQVNLVSLTVLGLRLLFMKTVVFNVLLTLRLWITS